MSPPPPVAEDRPGIRQDSRTDQRTEGRSSGPLRTAYSSESGFIGGVALRKYEQDMQAQALARSEAAQMDSTKVDKRIDIVHFLLRVKTKGELESESKRWKPTRQQPAWAARSA